MQFLTASLVSADPRSRARAESILESLSRFTPRIEDGSFTYSDAVTLARIVGQHIDVEKSHPDYRAPGSIYSELHGRLENVLNLLASGLESIGDLTARTLTMSGAVGVEHDAELADTLTRLVCATRGHSPEGLESAAHDLAGILQRYPLPAIKSAAPPDESHRNWAVVCVEDDPIWQRILRRTVRSLKESLPAYAIEVEVFSDRQAGERRLKELAWQHSKGAETFAPTYRPLAVLDMGIPKNARDKMSPSRDEGLRLLEAIRSPALNVTSVVLTTAPNLIGDHTFAARLGVSDYILKDIESGERLLEVLTRIITHRRRRRLRVFEETGRLIEVDGVQVTLEPSVFKTVAVLASEAPRSITVGEAIDLLEHKYGGYKQLAAPTEGLPARTLNLMNFWAQARRDYADAVGALSRLKAAIPYRLWRELLEELSQAGIAPDDGEAARSYMDARYAKASPAAQEFDPKNIEKHVHEARKVIKQSFNELGQVIFPEEEVIVNSTAGAEFAYKLIARVEAAASDSGPKQSEFRILVAENDVKNWQEPIRNLLTGFGYVVRTACSERQAVELARSFSPDLLCLDMHMPPDPAAFEADPFSGDAEAGLRVLTSVKTFLPDVRAVIMTDLVNDDSLRAKVVGAGARVSDFVQKKNDPSNPWEAGLLLRVYRVEQELRRSTFLPLLNLPMLPYVHLWRSRKAERYVEVFDRYVPTPENRFKLLWLLASREGRPVPTAEVMLKVYGEEMGREEALKQLVKNFRQQIAKDWFGITNRVEAKRVSEAVLANDAKAGWVLNARVQIDD
jgi:CheY-like chemotaxis protein